MLVTDAQPIRILAEAKSSGKRTMIQKGKNQPTMHTRDTYQD